MTIKNGIITVVRKSRNFQKNSKRPVEEADAVFGQLRNTTFAQSLRKKYSRADTSFAQVEIFVDDFVMGKSDFDIDKVLAALQNLNRLLL